MQQSIPKAGAYARLADLRFQQHHYRAFSILRQKSDANYLDNQTILTYIELEQIKRHFKQIGTTFLAA